MSLLNSQDVAIMGRILLRRELTASEVSSWSDQDYPNGKLDFIKAILATKDFVNLNLNNSQILARAYDAVMKRYDPDLPVDINHWEMLLGFQETVDSIITSFLDIAQSGYQNDACGSPLDGNQRIKVVVDSNGKPMIFTCGTNQHLYLFKFNTTKNNYEQIDLSEYLPLPPTKVQSYDVYTDNKGAVSVAVAVCPRRGQPLSTLYLATSIAQATLADDWKSIFKTIDRCTGLPEGAVISNVSFSVRDESDKPFVVVSLAVSGIMNNYYSIASSTINKFECVRIPQDADKVLLSHIGSYRKPGIWYLYRVSQGTINQTSALTFTTLSPDMYGKMINIDYTDLPANTSTFKVVPNQVSNVPAIFVAGNGISVYRSSHTMPEAVIAPHQAKGISFIEVSITEDTEYVWFIDDTQALKFTSKSRTATVWEEPQVVDTGIKSTAFIEFSPTQVLSAIDITFGRALMIKYYDQNTKTWSKEEIPVSSVWDENPLTIKELNIAIQKAAPIIYFDKKEQYKSSTVEFFLRRVGLWNTVKSDWELPKGSLWDENRNDIADSALIPRKRSIADGSTRHDADYTLKIDDEDYDAIIHGQTEDAPLYVHAKFIPAENSTDLVFWIFCPYNGPGTLSINGKTNLLGILGVHEGDWEHFVMRIDNDSLEVTKIFLSQHDGGEWINKSNLEIDTSTGRIILYISRNGHAFYNSAGDNLRELFNHLIVISLVNATSKGEVIKTFEDGKTKLISANFLGNDAPSEPRWLAFPWRWGKYFDITASDVSDAIKSFLESVEPFGGFILPVNDIIGAIVGKIAIDKNLLGGEGNSVGPGPIKFKDNWFSKE